MNQKRNQVTLRLPYELDQKLNGITEKLGISKNAFILMTLNKEIKQ